MAAGELVDWAVFARARAELGTAFVRILGYFREDGTKAVGAIEQAMRLRSAAALVLPAHTLKGEARQFGALPLAALAEDIEMTARHCVEMRTAPDELIQRVIDLRPRFEATLALFDRELGQMAERRAPSGFGRRPGAGFGVAQR
ncbi:Hpt domain-containing protein [Sphingomonas morindae]|uniref:Hpt domain-containing protein n=1 Tax=Sphingomonas morindae TaxID=1541170 RepID=A0ABY4XC53_9SPHN|nr:Hpt domain-containing protein [Sphingomonas morindae]USI74483.1 Hpt domain-containing protein [Sphingomonas morindae]